MAYQPDYRDKISQEWCLPPEPVPYFRQQTMNALPTNDVPPLSVALYTGTGWQRSSRLLRIHAQA